MIKHNYNLIWMFLFLPLSTIPFNHDFHVGTKHGYRRMHFNNPSKLDGFMTGLATGFNFSKKWFIAAIDYDGYWNTPLLRGNPCQSSKVHEHVFTSCFGGSWHACESFYFNGLVGIGLDHFLNHQDPNACPREDTDGLKYLYTKLFIPLRISGNWIATDNSTVSFCAEWRPDILARLKVRVKSNCDPLLCCTFKNKRSHGVRITLPITHVLHRNERLYIQITPFFDWNRFGSVCARNENGNPYTIQHLTRWDVGMQCLFGVQF